MENLSPHFPALIIIVPLIAALLTSAAGWLNRRLCFPFAALGLFTSLLVSTGLLASVLDKEVILYRLGGWPAPWGILYRIDRLNGLVLVVIFFVAFLNLIANKRTVEESFPEQLGGFYALYVLFVTGLSGMVATGDAFNLYVLLEISSLTGYALIGIGNERAPLAGLNYLFMGTIGASLYLLGIGFLYLMTGSLNMTDIASLLPGFYGSPVMVLAFLLCMTGLFIKMALFPLHAWLPNAYSFSPSASIGVIAPLTTKVMIYVMIRITFDVFTPDFSFKMMHLGEVMVWLAVAAIIMGSLFALAQTRLKRMLTYVIIAEVGYMVGGFWLGNRMAVTGAVLHILNDAVMTLCIFLAAGAVVYQICGDDFEDLKGLFRKMPISMAAFTVAALSLIGVPPTCGFFSKWYLISGGIAAGHYGFVVALLFSSLVNAVLFFRIIEIGYFEPFSEGEGGHGEHHGPPAMEIREAPAGMLACLLLAAVSLIVLGIYTGDIVTRIIDLAIPPAI